MNLKQFYIGKTIGFIVVILIILAYLFWVRSNPIQTPDDDWKTFTTSQGVIFRYPEHLSTEYIEDVDWPPQVTVIGGDFNCNEAGDETSRAGKTQKITIGTRTYCVTKVTEGAAGSIYTQYAYSTRVGENKLVNLTFSLRFVQCGNYDEPKKTQCEEERESFDIDGVIDRIVKTI